MNKPNATNFLKKAFNSLYFIILCSILNSCSIDEGQYFREGGSLLWFNGPLEDSVIKNAVKHTLENSSLIIAQVPWNPKDTSYFDNTAWYYSLAKEHGKKFMIAIDWQKYDRSGTIGNWSFENDTVSQLFKKDMRRLLTTYDPDFMNLGVEANYYALTTPKGFRAFAKTFREVKKELKQLKPEIKIGLSYQLELLYGIHDKWSENTTFATLDNIYGDIDYLGLSTYPNMVSKHKQTSVLSSTNYLDSITDKYSLPIGISETSVSSKKYNYQERIAYIKTIFQKATELDLEFIIWGSMVDACRDSVWIDKGGLIDCNGQPKKEFIVWKEENNKFCK